MYIIREVFKAKPGQASKLAKLFLKMFTPLEEGRPEAIVAAPSAGRPLTGRVGPKTRVMTDMVGPYNTVVFETEVESLAEWEKEMQKYRSGKADQKMNKELAKEMKNYTEMFIEGRREIYQIFE